MKSKLENTIPTIDRVTQNWQIYFILGLALLGGILFIAGIITGSENISTDLNRLSESTIMALIGFMSFCLFFPFAYILLLIKEAARSRRQFDELAKTIDSMKTQKSSVADG
ncbi:MAG: hypothetical protein JSW66_12165 [Phycisphaerales bacterium]|nr:MAG: hypothetical protein JSW66_12165 [Phycisphaerales bacterium]